MLLFTSCATGNKDIGDCLVYESPFQDYTMEKFHTIHMFFLGSTASEE